MGNWRGELITNWRAEGQKTILSSVYATAPLKFQRPFYPEGAEWAHGVVIHTAGGMVGGDQLLIRGNLEQGAKLCLTTPTATKVYRADVPQTVENYWQVKEGGILELFPQETILFAEAQFYQSAIIELAEGAYCCGWDIYRFGRTARGEEFRHGNWHSHTEIWGHGLPLWIDRQFLLGTPEFLYTANGLAKQPVLGTFWLVGLDISTALLTQLRALLTDTDGEIAMTRLLKGLVCRYRGQSTAQCREYFLRLWRCLRPLYGDRPLCVPPIWGG